MIGGHPVARTASTHSKPSGERNGIRAQRAFSPVELLNLWEPTGAWEEYRGLAYGEGPRQKLDVYKPRHAAKAPVLVFFYGGSWQRGSRDLYRFVGASLAAQGIVTVVPDYSIFPPARFPMFVEHAARAVRFARERSPQMGRAGSCMDAAQSGDACGINGVGRLKFQRGPDVELALGDSPIVLQNYPLMSAFPEPV
jgi:hypothetical protein